MHDSSLMNIILLYIFIEFIKQELPVLIIIDTFYVFFPNNFFTPLTGLTLSIIYTQKSRIIFLGI